MLWMAVEDGCLKIIKVKELVDTLFFHQFAVEEEERIAQAGSD